MLRTTTIRQAILICAALAVSMLIRGDAPAQPPALPDAAQVLDYVNQSIDWHRGIASLGQIVTNPADVLFFNETRLTGKEALQLSFDFAKAYAQYLSQQKPAPPQGGSQTPPQGRSLAQMAASADAEAKERESQLQTLIGKVQAAHGAARRDLQAQSDAVQSEVQLEQTRAQTLRTLAQFSGASSSGSLLTQVDELEKSVPELESGGNPNSPVSTAAASNPVEPTGIIAVAEDLIHLGHKSNLLKQSAAAADDLSQAAQKLRSPIVASLTAIAAQGDKALEGSGATTDYIQRKQQLDALTKQFKQLSETVLPLGKQAILLRTYRSNLDRWRQAVAGQYQTELKTLAVRLIVLAVVVFVLLFLAEIWRKAVIRYVHDLRRRYQFLLIRRILLWVAVAIAVAFALASQIGSIATYIGLVTAGVAVALQNVILAMAGYFFLIGKYGVRVGDRVQIGGVTGTVVDIGLFRLHLMEIGPPESGREPTGRVVVFPNSIVFQPGASFFKQIPGTSYIWHEVTLTLAPDTPYRTAEERLLRAVESVYDKYRDRMERQHRAMQETLNVEVALPRPHTRLRLTKTGIDVLIRFPTEVEKSSEIDDAVTRALLQAIEESPRLRLVGSGTATIQAVPDQPAAPEPAT
ncbi:MAG: mechanosensitive ion channel family protein [Terriglobales bacterium]